jgi:predicted dehydrogenase
MPDNMKENILLVGAGQMSIDYFKVLRTLNVTFSVVGRGKKSALIFKKQTGILPYVGGLTKFLSNNKNKYSKAIVAVGMEALKDVTTQLIDNSIKTILVEKPAGLNFNEIKKLANYANNKNAKVFVAYNRRFYASVLKTKKIIEEDGGVTSFNFEFTEWSHVIEKLIKAPGVKENWFLGNSTHVVDLAFYLGGKPKKIYCFTSGGLEWHPKASVFAGAGITENGALFSYHANWEAPGRWGVEVLTKKHRLILRPLEKLQIQNIGSINIEFLELNDQIDEKFKPGLYVEVTLFLKDRFESFLSISEQVSNLIFYKKIITGKKY